MQSQHFWHYNNKFEINCCFVFVLLPKLAEQICKTKTTGNQTLVKFLKSPVLLLSLFFKVFFGMVKGVRHSNNSLKPWLPLLLVVVVDSIDDFLLPVLEDLPDSATYHVTRRQGRYLQAVTLACSTTTFMKNYHYKQAIVLLNLLHCESGHWHDCNLKDKRQWPFPALQQSMVLI